MTRLFLLLLSVFTAAVHAGPLIDALTDVVKVPEQRYEPTHGGEHGGGHGGGHGDSPENSHGGSHGDVHGGEHGGGHDNDHKILWNFDNLPYTVIMYAPGSRRNFGHGIIVNRYWALSRAKEAEDIMTIRKYKEYVHLYPNVTDPSKVDCNTSNHRIVEIIKHGEYEDCKISRDIAMFKVCPAFDENHVAKLPSPHIKFNLGSFSSVYINNGTHLRYGDNEIVEDKLCSTQMADYNPKYHFCIGNCGNDVASVIGEPEWERVPFITSLDAKPEFRGLVVATDETKYAAVIRLGAFHKWFMENFPDLRDCDDCRK